MCDSVRNGPRLACACSSEHHDRTFERLGNGTLLGIQPSQHLLHAHRQMLACSTDVPDSPSTGSGSEEQPYPSGQSVREKQLHYDDHGSDEAVDQAVANLDPGAQTGAPGRVPTPEQQAHDTK